MEYLIGIILIATFFGLAYYCIKGYNLMIGFLAISVIWTILAIGGTGFASADFIAQNKVLQFGKDNTLISVLNSIFQTAPQNWGYHTRKCMLGCMVRTRPYGYRHCLHTDP